MENKNLEIIKGKKVLIVGMGKSGIAAVQAMRALGDLAESHRLVGIISHVAELKERIDKKILVRKSPRGSRVELET